MEMQFNQRRSTNIALLLGLVVLIAVVNPTNAQSTPNKKIRVVTFVEAPWVTQDGDTFSGFYFDLWQAIAAEANLDYEVQTVDNFGDLYNFVAKGKADIAVYKKGMNVNEEEFVDFTHALSNDGLRVVVRATTGRLGQIIEAFRSLFPFIFISLLVVLLVAHLYWLVEEWKAHPEYKQPYRQGIWHALWWTVITFTTVGYGDEVPKSTPGRVVALGWMLISAFLLSLFVAGFASALTVTRVQGGINGIQDLPGHVVGTWEFGRQRQLLADLGIEPIIFATTPELRQALESGEVEAIVVDTGTAEFLTTTDFRQFQLAGSPVSPGNIAFTLAQGSPYLEAVNQAILTIFENGTYAEIYGRSFGSKN